MISLAQARPPFVEFKRVPKHDPIRSEELGRRVTKDVNMAFIMQPGSKDQVERVAEDWLASIKRKALDAAPDAFPHEWVAGFHSMYESWKAGHEQPLNGTSVKEWPVLSPAQAENFISIGILCIEDVAAMTEEALSRFGMGCRELREKAREWIQGKNVAGSMAEENNALKKTIAELTARLEQLEANSAEQKPARKQRKPREQNTVE